MTKPMKGRVAQVIGGTSDLVGEDLKFTNTVVFMVSTLSDTQHRLAPLLRAFAVMSLYAFQTAEPEKVLRHPCNFYLDEYPQMGRVPMIAMAAPGLRKVGAKLYIFSQSIGLLAKANPEDYREFLNQAEAVVWMGLSSTDTTSLTFLTREVLGECLRKEKVDGFHWIVRGLARILGLQLPPARYQMVARPLLTNQQAAAFLDRAHGQIIVTREGKAAMRLRRLLYWKELPVWRYAVHRGHGESSVWRRMTRRLFAWRAVRRGGRELGPPSTQQGTPTGGQSVSVRTG